MCLDKSNLSTWIVILGSWDTLQVEFANSAMFGTGPSNFRSADDESSKREEKRKEEKVIPVESS